jgi:hypothetical protein
MDNYNDFNFEAQQRGANSSAMSQYGADPYAQQLENIKDRAQVNVTDMSDQMGKLLRL